MLVTETVTKTILFPGVSEKVELLSDDPDLKIEGTTIYAEIVIGDKGNECRVDNNLSKAISAVCKIPV